MFSHLNADNLEKQGLNVGHKLFYVFGNSEPLKNISHAIRNTDGHSTDFLARKNISINHFGEKPADIMCSGGKALELGLLFFLEIRFLDIGIKRGSSAGRIGRPSNVLNTCYCFLPTVNFGYFTVISDSHDEL